MTARKLVSLLELLRVYADRFVSMATRFKDETSLLNGPDIWQDEKHRTFLIITLRELDQMCQDSELPVTGKMVKSLLKTFDLAECESDEGIKELAREQLPNHFLAHELHTLNGRFRDELATKLFLQIPHNRSQFFDEPLAGWEAIVKRFDSCIRDVEEMNRCFALSRYPAAMFHALHVAEWGAIVLGDKIGVTDPKKGWGPTFKKLNELVKAGHGKLPPTVSVTFEFLEQMHREIETMMLAWRHKVDHAANTLAIVPNADFTPDIAEHIIQSTKVFMSRLMDGI